MHKSVLLGEVIDSLNIKKNGKYLDCTLGYAGHSSEILKRLENEGFLFAFDQDEDAIEYSQKRLSAISNNFKIFKTNFKDIEKYINEKLDGIIYDLGVSSPQLDNKDRGFSFHEDAPLDMRMDKSALLSAKQVVNEYEEKKLAKIFYEYGEEKYSKNIAKNIVENRPVETTLELVEIIKNSVPEKYKRETHPARKVFQAIRIEVNNELGILESSIKKAFELLKPGGRICVITFHSLEDRIIKKVFNELSKDSDLAKNLPYVPEEMKRKGISITKKPIVPSEKELKENNRSRSAKLRVIEKV
ncbi:MAG: 16S rRNA (cytosine(1402)-N(4))-methyltransferase RsmH [Bacilli bacterium]|nr:16S rRNA (cytosine(1402)-N(4))-methyltransferase RsmH [Bacilli bacterium]